MDNAYIEMRFCKYLKEYVDLNSKNEGAGYISRLAKKLGKSQGYLSNVIAGRRPGSETWRRFVADKLGLDYEVMIGLSKKPQKTTIYEMQSSFEVNEKNNRNVIMFPGIQSEYPRFKTCMENLRIIIESEYEDLKGAIDANLVAFKSTVDNRNEIKTMKQNQLSMTEEIESLKRIVNSRSP